MRNYKHIYKYNELYFKSSEINHYLNHDFWECVYSICEKHPNEKFIIEHSLVKQRNVSYLAEKIKCYCDSSDIQKVLNEIYNTYYHYLPLTFQKEFEGKTYQDLELSIEYI